MTMIINVCKFELQHYMMHLLGEKKYVFANLRKFYVCKSQKKWVPKSQVSEDPQI